MSVERRAEIFSKECLTIADLQELFELDYQLAAKLLRDIKRQLEFKGQKLRLNMQGKIHVEDYLDYFGIKNVERYVPKKLEN
jgi:hypothetical protein